MKKNKYGVVVKRAEVKRKEPKIKVTPKQRAAAKALSDNLNPGKKVKTQSEVLQSIGYSATVAANPSMITESKGFRVALAEYGVTDEKISRVYSDAMDANRVATIDGTPVETDIADHAIRLRAADSVAKLKGYGQEQQQGSGNTYNTFLQQNNLDPNAPESKSIVDLTLDMLMNQMRRVE